MEPIRKEIWGIFFFLIALILGVSLYSYHPADPLFWNNTGPAANTHNLFGTLGAHFAGGFFFLLGFSSFWLVLVFLTFSFLSFRGQILLSSARTLIAALCLILSFAGILSLQIPKGFSYRGGEVISGGLIGVYIAGLMKEFLNYFGAYVFLMTIFVLSLMICTHISFGWVFIRLGLWLSILFRRMREFLLKTKEKRRKKRAREKTIQERKAKPRAKVVIVEPPPEPPKKPKQESFSFMNIEGNFRLPSLDLLNELPGMKDMEIQRESLEMNARRLEKKLADYGVQGEVSEIHPGPVITMYEYKPAPGVKISKVAGLSDDLALALRAPSIRIVAPIPGKAAIGIEIPNNQRDPVYLNEILASQAYKETTFRLTIALGKDITGSPFITDLSKMPHLLVAGATGTGKSVSLNAMINSLLFSFSPDTLQFLMIDPKRIELSVYKDIPHLLYPVVTQPGEATKLLRWTVREMERRYVLLSDQGVRNIETYNRKILKDGKAKLKADNPEEKVEKPLPYIVLVIDELADLMLTSSREVEEAITRLAQMARAAGIHLIIATQRPSVDVLTGIIKANFPARISFQVSSKVDSRTILDTIGAEHLLGDGDMLFMPPGVGKISRIHGAYISEEEIKRVTNFLREQMKPNYDTGMLTQFDQEDEVNDTEIELDEKYDQAVELVAQTRQASISMLQRRLRVGYNRAARMIEAMEREGIVGPSDGIRPREVFARKRDQ
ncbi:MAG: DNA translocase FtsK 4TM domain-containing protein [Deltaproteobacteria bacterium]|nr:DNA translocase FtsK 4TM domain-containing protein [Deltaproteobacteria bacterium]